MLDAAVNSVMNHVILPNNLPSFQLVLFDETLSDKRKAMPKSVDIISSKRL